MIQVDKLTKNYGTTMAIQDLCFQVGRGEIVGFLGPNGAGKSTTMRILAGAMGATSGTASVGGCDVFEKPREVKAMVGYLPEVPPLYPDMTVRGYLRYVGKLKGADQPAEAAERIISRVGLVQVAHRLIDHLSLGFRQRVGIAQALVHAPKVLILDEPARGLDPAQRVEIRNLVKELAAGDVTVILSTHVLSEVEAICDRVLIVHQGRIVSQGRLDDLAGTQVNLLVAQPSDELVNRLHKVEGVVAVQERDAGRYVISAKADIRSQVAHAAVEAGLLELSGGMNLEAVYLDATAAK